MHSEEFRTEYLVHGIYSTKDKKQGREYVPVERTGFLNVQDAALTRGYIVVTLGYLCFIKPYLMLLKYLIIFISEMLPCNGCLFVRYLCSGPCISN